jgi:DNA-binding MurR/RpiR family transcriptional regulator
LRSNHAAVSRAGAPASSLSVEIRARFDGFSPSQRDVGQYIVDHLDDASFHTAEELARRAGTSSSTVVRFAQALGFEGFPELQAAAQVEYRRLHEAPRVRPVTGADDGGAAPDLVLGHAGPATELYAALEADRANVEDTARHLGAEDVQATVELISAASRIVLCGTDQMAFFASYLRHLLMLLDVRSEVVAGSSPENLARLGRLDGEGLLIVLSAGRPRPLVLRALARARQRRAPTVAIADGSLSEVAKLADRCLLYSSTTPAYVRSHSALLSLLQALAYAVYARDESSYAERIKLFRLK